MANLPALMLMQTFLTALLLLMPAPGSDLQISASGPQQGVCSAALPDGRSFITGGLDANGPLATTGYFERDGSITPGPSMLSARANHICVALADGVLVAGGIGPDGVTNSAEIFHPETNSWTPTGPMLTLRQKAAAVVLKDGTVLVVGGEVSGQMANTLEIYDATEERFHQAAGIISPARTGHALAVLDDGRVLIAGGSDGKLVLDSIEIFDPSEGIFAGGRMSSPRANFTATLLSSGKVLFAGGTDGSSELASAELFDPATGEISPTEPLASPRQNHIAVRLGSSENVLIAAGTTAGRPANSAEFFMDSQGAFALADEGSGEGKSRSITIGVIGANGTVRSAKTYRVP
jgi:large repetitive protein